MSKRNKQSKIHVLKSIDDKGDGAEQRVFIQRRQLFLLLLLLLLLGEPVLHLLDEVGT